MKNTLRLVALMLVMVMSVLMIVSCSGSKYGAIKKSFENAGYTEVEADGDTNTIVASLEEGDLQVTAHRLEKKGDILTYNALVLEFGSDEDLQKALADNETLKGFIKDSQESDIVNGNCILVPLSFLKASEMITIFNESK